MRTRLKAALALVALTALPLAASGEPVGPFCFSTAPFPDIFEWFFEAGAGSNFVITGRDLSGGRPMSAFGYVGGDTFHLGYNTYPDAMHAPVIGGASIDLNTLSGPGLCFAPDLESCGEFTIALIECPPPAAARDRVRRAQGQPQ